MARIKHLLESYRNMVITLGAGLVSLILWGIGKASGQGGFVTASIVVIAALSIYIAFIILGNIMTSLKSGNVGTDMLAIIALISTLATAQFPAAWILCVMVCTGDVIETFAEHRARKSVSALAAAAPMTANVIFEPYDSPSDALTKQWKTVGVKNVRIGDTLLVRPGETVPADGQLLTDAAELNVSMINGEPLPQQALAGDKLLSGSINGESSLAMRVTAAPQDSQYQKIIDLVASAQASKAPVVRLADRISVPFTIASLLIGIISWIVTKDATRFTQVMVLATPCPLLIAAPVAFIGGTNQLAKAHVIIKNQAIIESLTHVTHVFFDKTGTLTTTQPQVTAIHLLPEWEKAQEARLALAESPDQPGPSSRPAPSSRTGERLDSSWIIQAAGAVEAYSLHILAKGIIAAGRAEAAKEGQSSLRRFVAQDVSESSGKGLSAMVDGHQVKVGRLAFVDPALTHSPGFFPALKADEMATYISVDGALAARLTLRDVPRSNARKVIGELLADGVRHVTMLTGDRPQSTAVVAQEVGISDVRAALLPQDKYNAVRFAREADSSTDKQVTTMMVGDGVNDAPVLAAADVSVAMTDGSSTAAAQTAKVVIMSNDLEGLNTAIAISRRTVRIMLQAVLGGIIAALISMMLAAFGLIPTIVGALLQELIDATSILWALRAAFDRKA